MKKALGRLIVIFLAVTLGILTSDILYIKYVEDYGLPLNMYVGNR